MNLINLMQRLYKFSPPVIQRLGVILVLVITSSSGLWAQRFAYVDIEYVLQNVPEYQQAQQQLDSISNVWQQEIEGKKKQIRELKQQYQEEKVFLTDKMKQQRQQKIRQQEEALERLRHQRFGEGGDLFEKRKELIRPIQDKVYNAIEAVAERRRYDFILDKSAGTVILYSDPKYDKSNMVLEEMGYEPGQQKEDGEKKKNSK